MAFPFDPAATSFSLTNALGCGLAAQLAYADAPTVDRTVKDDWGFEEVAHYASPPGPIYDTQAFLAARADLVLVAFRGTEPENVKDWLTDADIALVRSPLGEVHAGFWNAFSSVWPAMLRDIRAALSRSDRPVWLAGHSLGAALSTLAVASCHDAQVPVAGHYTFGSPRVGAPSFVNAYDPRYATVTFRFVNNNDIVPRVPPRALAYRHVDTRRYLDSRCRLVTDPRMLDLVLDSFEGSLLGLRALFEEVARRRGERLPLPDFLEDHRIENYVACIRKNLPQQP